MSTRITAGTVLLAATFLAGSASAASPLMLGPSTHKQLALYQGYYDGHKDGYVITDVSNKAQAKAWHVNFAPILKGAKGAPPQYFVSGRALRVSSPSSAPSRVSPSTTRSGPSSS